MRSGKVVGCVAYHSSREERAHSLYRLRNKLVERRLHIAHSLEREDEERGGGRRLLLLLTERRREADAAEENDAPPRQSD